MTLRAYMVWSGDDPSEGALLVFHYTARAAKKLGHPVLVSWFDDHRWFDVRARWLREPHIQDLRIDTEPHVIESPPTCPGCEAWGGKLGTGTATLERRGPILQAHWRITMAGGTVYEGEYHDLPPQARRELSCSLCKEEA